MIRVATEADIPRILELGRVMHQESPSFRGFEFDVEKVEQVMRGLLAGAGVIFIYERGGEIIGGVAGCLTEFWFSREKIASDYSLFVDPESRHGLIAVKLTLAFHNWAKLMGARRVQMGITTGVHTEQTGMLYRSLGMDDSGQLFKRDF